MLYRIFCLPGEGRFDVGRNLLLPYCCNAVGEPPRASSDGATPPAPAALPALKRLSVDECADSEPENGGGPRPPREPEGSRRDLSNAARSIRPSIEISDGFGFLPSCYKRRKGLGFIFTPMLHASHDYA